MHHKNAFRAKPTGLFRPACQPSLPPLRLPQPALQQLREIREYVKGGKEGRNCTIAGVDSEVAGRKKSLDGHGGSLHKMDWQVYFDVFGDLGWPRFVRRDGASLRACVDGLDAL